MITWHSSKDWRCPVLWWVYANVYNESTTTQFNFLTLSGRRDDRGRSPPAAYSYAHQGGAYRLSCLFDQNHHQASISRLTCGHVRLGSCQSLHPPNFYTEILSKIWVNSCLSEWKSEFYRANLRHTVIHAPEWMVGTNMEVYKNWLIFNYSLVPDIHIKKWGWRCVIVVFQPC